jgi:hypothetical protein
MARRSGQNTTTSPAIFINDEVRAGNTLPRHVPTAKQKAGFLSKHLKRIYLPRRPRRHQAKRTILTDST